MEIDFFIITSDSSTGKSLVGQLPKDLYRARTLTSLKAMDRWIDGCIDVYRRGGHRYH